MARIGFDDVAGYLADPHRQMTEHPKGVGLLSWVTASHLAEQLAASDSGIQLVDVRNPGETRLGMIPGARCIPLPRLREDLDDLDRSRPVVINCAGGYRSAIGASLLNADGSRDASHLLGGYAAWLAMTAANSFGRLTAMSKHHDEPDHLDDESSVRVTWDGRSDGPDGVEVDAAGLSSDRSPASSSWWGSAAAMARGVDRRSGATMRQGSVAAKRSAR